jgi:secreted Zn-dependent insulinase-like peptidase
MQTLRVRRFSLQGRYLVQYLHKCEISASSFFLLLLSSGLRFAIGNFSSNSTLEVGVSGFSHKLRLLVKTVFNALVALPSLPEATLRPIFERRVDAKRRALMGFSKSQPLALAADLVDQYLDYPYVSNADKLAAIDAVTLNDVRAFGRGLQLSQEATGGSVDNLSSSASAMAFVYGNVLQADAVDIACTICKAFAQPASGGSVPSHNSLSPALLLEGDGAAASASSEPQQHVQTLLLPAGTDAVVWKAHPNPGEVNCGLVVSWQLGVRTPRNSAAATLLTRLMSAEAFNTLRTQEQLGYIVQSGATSVNGTVITMSIKVCSN